MQTAERADRLDRLKRRGDGLLVRLTNLPPEAAEVMRSTWTTALVSAQDGAEDHTSVLDAVLSLFERITEPTRWLSDVARSYDLARRCLVDAVQHARVAAMPPPLLAVEAVGSPLYLPRVFSPATWLPQAAAVEIGLPVVVCDGNMIEEPWTWATLFHELGHHLDAACGDSAALFDTLEPHATELGSWGRPRWLAEVVGDLYAGLLGGDGAVEALAARFTDRPYSASHPSDDDRAAVLRSAWHRVRHPETTIAALDRDTRPREIVALHLAAHFTKTWGARVAADYALDRSEPRPLRLWPGALHREYTCHASPHDLRTRMLQAGDQMAPPTWTMTDAHRNTLRVATANLVATHTLVGPDGIKVPPMDLLIRHDKMYPSRHPGVEVRPRRHSVPARCLNPDAPAPTGKPSSSTGATAS